MNKNQTRLLVESWRDQLDFNSKTLVVENVHKSNNTIEIEGIIIEQFQVVYRHRTKDFFVDGTIIYDETEKYDVSYDDPTFDINSDSDVGRAATFFLDQMSGLGSLLESKNEETIKVKLKEVIKLLASNYFSK